jgi:hypothetical protein
MGGWGFSLASRQEGKQIFGKFLYLVWLAVGAASLLYSFRLCLSPVLDALFDRQMRQQETTTGSIDHIELAHTAPAVRDPEAAAFPDLENGIPDDATVATANEDFDSERDFESNL